MMRIAMLLLEKKERDKGEALSFILLFLQLTAASRTSSPQRWNLCCCLVLKWDFPFKALALRSEPSV